MRKGKFAYSSALHAPAAVNAQQLDSAMATHAMRKLLEERRPTKPVEYPQGAVPPRKWPGSRAKRAPK